MRLRHIEVFHAIRRHGSISRASDVLAISQPAVSKILKHAEISLGFPLFNRAHGRLEPTEQAEILFAETERLMLELETARRVARNLRQHLSAPLRIGCIAGLGMGLVPLAATLFRKARDRAGIDIGIRRSSDLVRALLTHELDLGVDVRPVESFQIPSGLRSELLFEGEMVHIERAPKTAAGAKRRTPPPFRLEDVDGEGLIGLNPDDLMGAMVRDALERHGVIDVSPVHVHTHFVAKSMVTLGGGSAILDEFTVAAGGSEGLRVRRLEPRIAFSVQVLMPTFRASSASVDHFVEALHEAGRQLRAETSANPE